MIPGWFNTAFFSPIAHYLPAVRYYCSAYLLSPYIPPLTWLFTPYPIVFRPCTGFTCHHCSWFPAFACYCYWVLCCLGGCCCARGGTASMPFASLCLPTFFYYPSTYSSTYLQNYSTMCTCCAFMGFSWRGHEFILHYLPSRSHWEFRPSWLAFCTPA